MITEKALSHDTDFLVGFRAGCADIDHGLPVRRFDGCTAQYIDGYAQGYTSKARQALEQLLASSACLWGNGPDNRPGAGDALSEDDIADYRLEQRSYRAAIAKMEKEIYSST